MRDMDKLIIAMIISWGLVAILAIISIIWVKLNPPEPMTPEEEAEYEEALQMACEIDVARSKQKKELGWYLKSGL